MKHLILVIIFILFLSSIAYSSQLKITNISLDDINTKKHYAKIQFDIAWDDAWKNDINCDGIWVFAKFRIADGEWGHITLKTASKNDFNYKNQTPSKFSKGSNKEIGIWIPEHKKGAFIFRTKGEGDVKSEKIKFLWDYEKDNIKDMDIKNANIKVLGIEMVYIPEDKHYVGDPKGKDGPMNCLYTYPDGGAYLIDSEEAITIDEKEGYLYCDQDNVRGRDDIPFTIPLEYPKGYKAFWIMKYELNAQQYVDFLNTLNRKQQNARTETDISTDIITNYYVMSNTNEETIRNSIVAPKKDNGTEKPITFYTYAPSRASNFFSWADVSAYADWTGLRPMTELEFEKACRGPEQAITGESAWGNVEDIGRADTFNGADGSGYEIKVPTKGIINCSYGGGIAPFEIAKGKTIPTNPGFEGPVSNGLFANTQHIGISKRINDGASYYGVMELSGNVWETAISLGVPEGRKYKPTYGDGYLDKDGYANISDWPDKTALGSAVRGGVWSSPEQKYVAVALRFAGVHTKYKRGINRGCRLVF